MNTLRRTLERIAGELTAKERALLELGSLKEAAREDPAWRKTMPDEQGTEFNHYISLMNAANVDVSILILSLSQQVELLESDLARLAILGLWEKDIRTIRKATTARSRKPAVVDEIKDAFHIHGFDVISQDLREALECQARLTWSESRAVGMVLEGIQEEFDGVDPLRAFPRERFEAALASLEVIVSALKIQDLVEPDKETVALVWESTRKRENLYPPVYVVWEGETQSRRWNTR